MSPTPTPVIGNQMWPTYLGPDDLETIESVPLAQRDLPRSTYELLVRAAQTWPTQVATSVLPSAERWRESTETTFVELLGKVHAIANSLTDLGVGRNDAVAVLSPNCDDLVATVLGSQLAGIVAPLNPGLGTHECADLISRSGARVLIAAGPALDPAAWTKAEALATLGAVDTILVLEPTGASDERETVAPPGVRVAHLRDLIASADHSGFHGTPPRAEDVAALFHTGGSTGTPKLAAHLHRNEVADAWMIAANSDLDGDAVVFAALPLFHVNALVVTLLAPLFKGQRVVWAGPAGYRDFALYGVFWSLVEAHRVSAMSAVPTVYSVLATCPVDADISSLRFAMVGASPLPPAVREAFETATGVRLVEGYGLTEATCASVRSFPGHPGAEPNLLGQRLPYQQVKAVEVLPDGSWRDLPPGQVGHLAISGPTVFPGYVTGRDALGLRFDGLGKLRDGWLDTGDLATVDERGFVRLTGRAKDLIIRGGHNIDPQSIEDALLTHPEVTGAGAVGCPDEHAGEVPVAFVTLVAGSSLTPEDLLAHAAATISEAAARPKLVSIVDALPVTDVGKPYKPELRRLAAHGHLRAQLENLEGLQLEVQVVDGSLHVTATAPSTSVVDAARSILSRYALSSEVVLESGPTP